MKATNAKIIPLVFLLLVLGCAPNTARDMRALKVSLGEIELTKIDYVVHRDGRALMILAKIPTGTKGSIELMENCPTTTQVGDEYMPDEAFAYITTIAPDFAIPEWFKDLNKHEIKIYKECQLNGRTIKTYTSDTGEIWLIAYGDKW